MKSCPTYSEAKRHQARGQPLTPAHRQALAAYQKRFNERRVTLVLPSADELERWRELQDARAHWSFSHWVVEMVQRGLSGVAQDSFLALEERVRKAEGRAEDERDRAEEHRQEVKRLNGLMESWAIELASKQGSRGGHHD